MRKLLRTVLLAVFAAVFFTGCTDPTKLGSRAIIQAAAVDYDGGYHVSALMFSSGGGSGDTIDASQENVIKVTGDGKTLSEAIDNISLVDGKKIYMCETKLLILGSGFEDESALEALRTLYYEMRCGLNMPVCYAESAESITDLHFTEGITSAEKPLSMIENAYAMGYAPKTTLLDLLAESVGGHKTLIPMFRIAENGRGMTLSDDNKTAVLCGTRSMENGKLGDAYAERETAGLMLVYGLSDKITLNYRFEGHERTCEAYGVKVHRGGSGLTVTAKFRTRAGSSLSEEERAAALRELTAIVQSSL